MIDIVHSSSIEDGSSQPESPENNDISNIKVRDDDEENKRRRETRDVVPAQRSSSNQKRHLDQL